MAEFDDEQQDKSKLQEGGEEGARYGSEKLAKKLKGGSEKGAEEAGKKAGKQVGKQAAKRGAQAATAPETAGVGPAVIEAADQAQQAVRDPVKAVKKGGMVILLGIGAVITSVFAVLFVVIAIPIIIIAVLIGAVDIGEASQSLTMTKVVTSPSPPNLPNGVADGDTADVEFTITLTNNLDVSITGIVINDTACPNLTDYELGDLAAKASSVPVTVTCPVPTFPIDTIYTNRASAYGTAQFKNGGVADPQLVGATASANVVIGSPQLSDPFGWPVSGNINQTPYCPYDPPPPAGSGNCPTHDTLPAWDIGAMTLTPIYSTHGGIAYQGNNPGGYGTYVIVEGDTYSTMYSHMPDEGGVNLSCVPGSVGPGALIGFVNSSGNSTGPHLHYEIRWTILGGNFFTFNKLTTPELSSLGYDWSSGFATSSYSGTGCGAG